MVCQVSNKDEEVTKGIWDQHSHHLVNEWLWGRWEKAASSGARILSPRGPVPFGQTLYPSLLVHLIRLGALVKEEGLDLIS